MDIRKKHTVVPHLANEGKRLLRADSFDGPSVVTPAENAKVYKLFMRKLQPLHIGGDRWDNGGVVNDPFFILQSNIDGSLVKGCADKRRDEKGSSKPTIELHRTWSSFW